MSHLMDIVARKAERSATVPGICRRASRGDTVYAIRKAAVSPHFIPEAAHLIHTCRVNKDTKCGVYAHHVTDSPGQPEPTGDGAFLARSLYMIFAEYSAALEYAAAQVSKALDELTRKGEHARAVLDDLRISLEQELLRS